MGFRNSRIPGIGRACFVFLAGLLVAADALAIPVQWTVSGTSDAGGALFDDGGDLNRTFFYDADTDTYSGLSLKTSNGSRDSPFTGASYNSADPSLSTANVLVAIAAGTRLELHFTEALSNLGGSVGLASGSETLTSGTDAGSLRFLDEGGEAFGVPVPEPSTACLVALGLSGLAVQRRSRR
jgi:hypothetical protein